MIDWHCTSEDIQAYVDGELDGARRQVCEEHLDRCDGCARLAGRLLLLSQTLGAIPPQTTPVDLYERVMRAVARAEGVEALDCATSREMISAYVDDELSAADRARLESHVFACPECYANLRHTQSMAEALRVVAPAPAPAGLHESIIAALERDARPAPVFTWRRVAVAAAGVAAAVAIWVSTVMPNVAPATAPMIASAPVSPRIEAPMSVTPEPVSPVANPAPVIASSASVSAPPRTVTRHRAAVVSHTGAVVRHVDTPAAVETPETAAPAVVTPATPVVVANADEPVAVPDAKVDVPAPLERPTAIAVVPPSVRVSVPAVVDEPTVGVPATTAPSPTPVAAPSPPVPKPVATRRPGETVIAYRTEATRFDGGSAGRNTGAYTRMAEAINARVGAREWITDSAGIQIH